MTVVTAETAQREDPAIVIYELVKGAEQSAVLRTHEVTGQLIESAFMNKSFMFFPTTVPPP